MLRRLGLKLLRRGSARSRPAEVADTVSTAVREALRPSARAKTAQHVAPALLLATGAGVAFLWWTQWARGQAESDQAESDQAESEGAAAGNGQAGNSGD